MKNELRRMVLILAVAVLTLPGMGSAVSTGDAPGKHGSTPNKPLPIGQKDGGGPTCPPSMPRCAV